MRNSDDDIIICSEKKCAVKFTEGRTQSIYCDVCSKIYCLKCMGMQKKNGSKIREKINNIPQEMDRTYSKVLQNHVRDENKKTIVKSVSEAVRDTTIENKKTQDKET